MTLNFSNGGDHGSDHNGKRTSSITRISSHGHIVELSSNDSEEETRAKLLINTISTNLQARNHEAAKLCLSSKDAKYLIQGPKIDLAHILILAAYLGNVSFYRAALCNSAFEEAQKICLKECSFQAVKQNQQWFVDSAIKNKDYYCDKEVIAAATRLPDYIILIASLRYLRENYKPDIYKALLTHAMNTAIADEQWDLAALLHHQFGASLDGYCWDELSNVQDAYFQRYQHHCDLPTSHTLILTIYTRFKSPSPPSSPTKCQSRRYLDDTETKALDTATSDDEEDLEESLDAILSGPRRQSQQGQSRKPKL